MKLIIVMIVTPSSARVSVAIKAVTLVLKKSTTTKGMAKLASDALLARLFVYGWVLSHEFTRLKESTERYKTRQSLTIAYLDDVPVGACLTQKWKNTLPMVMTFVRKKHRRSGIGTQLIKKAMGRKNFKYVVGLKAARPFFDQFPNAKDGL